MIQIIVNEQPVQLLEVLPKEIYSLTIISFGLFPVDKVTGDLVRAWCREIKLNLTCEWIEVNGVLISVDEI